MFAGKHLKIMNRKSETGTLGEDAAIRYLEDKNFSIIRRNIRDKWGEIDILCLDSSKTLVFVEVKTIRQNNPAIAGLTPEDNLTAAKLKKMKRTAQMFAGKHPELINDKSGWRIDLIAITMFAGKHSISHYENL